MNIIRLIPVGLFASVTISFFSPMSAYAHSKFVEGPLIAGAGNKENCEAKGKVWQARYLEGWLTNEWCAEYGTDNTEFCSCQAG